MIKFQLTIIILFVGLICAQSQTTEIRRAYDLDFMVGVWQGSGWQMTRTGRSTSEITETAHYALDSTLLIVEGKGVKTDSVTGEMKVVHHAYGIIAFDVEQKSFALRAYKEGQITDSPVEIVDEKVIRWRLDLPGGASARFTADFTRENIWKETGEFNRRDGNWMHFMEMELEREGGE